MKMNETFKDRAARLKMIEPKQSFKNLVKDKFPVSAIYSKTLKHDQSYQIICCCKDSFYRIFEFDLGDTKNDSNSDVNMLRLVNKYQINSYVDLIESFIFDEDFVFSNASDESR